MLMSVFEVHETNFVFVFDRSGLRQDLNRELPGLQLFVFSSILGLILFMDGVVEKWFYIC